MPMQAQVVFYCSPALTASSPMYFVASLTSLFESVALIIDQHQPLVEKYYGSAAMAPVVAKLLDECHRAFSQLLDAWEEDRQMQRKLADTSSPIAPAAAPTAAVRRQGAQAPTPTDDPVDPREIDKVLSELAGLASRWAVFRKFVIMRLNEPEESEDDESGHSQAAAPVDTSIVDDCACRKLMETTIEKYYLPLENWYLHTIVEKAHRLAQPSSSSGPTTTTLPDDVFYVLKLALVRLLTTGSITNVTRTCAALKDLISK